MNRNDIKVLKELYKNADMGADSIKTLLGGKANGKICTELRSQLRTYSLERRSIYNQLSATSAKPYTVSPMSKMMARISINASTAMNPSDSHIAQMMLQGTNMGVINITKTLNNAGRLSPEVKSAADKMLENEQIYMDKLKKYL